ncbi:MAG: hypothetical protein AVDCRST_MAG16-3027, partial [uncultured Frankineae bacterium]
WGRAPNWTRSCSSSCWPSSSPGGSAPGWPVSSGRCARCCRRLTARLRRPAGWCRSGCSSSTRPVAACRRWRCGCSTTGAA